MFGSGPKSAALKPRWKWFLDTRLELYMLTQFTAEYLHTHTRAHTQTHSFPACVTVCVALFMQAASVLLWPAHPTQTTSTSLASGDFSVLLHLQERSSVPWNIWERCYCKVRRRSGLSTEGKSERKVKNKREKWGRETGGEKKSRWREKQHWWPREGGKREREMEVKGEAKKQKMGTGRHVSNNICEGGRGSCGCVREKAFQTTSVPRSTSLMGGEVRGRRDLKVRARRGDDWRCLEWRLMLLTQQADTGSSCIFYRRRNISW